MIASPNPGHPIPGHVDGSIIANNDVNIIIALTGKFNWISPGLSAIG
jgi:hypothetical protein